MKLRYIPFFLGLVASLSSACSSSTQPTAVGSITGTVKLLDPNGNALPSAGVTASLGGTTFTNQSDANGIWRIDNVPAGNYDITVSKPGFGMVRVYGVAVAGPGLAHLDPMSIGQAPTDIPAISAVEVTTFHGTNVVAVRFPRGLAGIPYFDTNANVQPGDAHCAAEVCSGLSRFNIEADSIQTAYYYSIADLNAAGIPSGKTVYISASYANISCSWRNTNIDCSGSYFDPLHNRYRFISPGPRSNVVSIVMP